MRLEPDQLSTAVVPVADLIPHPDNPRRGNVDAIAESLTFNGQYRPLVVQANTNTVLAGNHTLAAATQLDWELIAVTFVDVDDDQAVRIMLADNRTSDLGVYDDEQLAAILDALNDTDGTGYTADALAELDAALTPPSDDEWAATLGDAGGNPDGPAAYTRTFTLTADQAATVDEAITDATDPDDDGNHNGAALARIARHYLTTTG